LASLAKQSIAKSRSQVVNGDRSMLSRDVRGRYQSLNPQNSEAIDLLTPLERGRKTGLLGGAGVGKTVHYGN
jgi:F0F1-type ATP synthase beta subunit